MGRVTVIIGAAGEEQIQIARKPHVPASRRRIVIRMVRLQCIEPCLAQRGDARIDARLTRMCKRSHSPGVVDDAYDSLRGGAGARHECRISDRQPSVERVTDIGDVSGRHERSCDLRSAHRMPDITTGLLAERLNVDWKTQSGKLLRYRLHACHPLPALTSQKIPQRLIVRFEEISKDVDVAPFLDGGDLNAGHGLNPALRCEPADDGDCGYGIVIRDGQHAHPCGR